MTAGGVRRRWVVQELFVSLIAECKLRVLIILFSLNGSWLNYIKCTGNIPRSAAGTQELYE
jgi:hypothetical protein